MDRSRSRKKIDGVIEHLPNGHIAIKNGVELALTDDESSADERPKIDGINQQKKNKHTEQKKQKGQKNEKKKAAIGEMMPLTHPEEPVDTPVKCPQLPAEFHVHLNKPHRPLPPNDMPINDPTIFFNNMGKSNFVSKNAKSSSSSSSSSPSLSASSSSSPSSLDGPKNKKQSNRQNSAKTIEKTDSSPSLFSRFSRTKNPNDRAKTSKNDNKDNDNNSVNKDDIMKEITEKYKTVKLSGNETDNNDVWINEDELAKYSEVW
ncbi:hypothetical protein niasHS_013810 [Heterodera schachtii]|uniref:Uncharacterized protein n=1 Tax=Heterodera schachtii TaxID=97005 RepID=A0ABD2IVB0_HETSC